MAFPQGINFRNTSGYVTDPTPNYAVDTTGGGFDYPFTTPQGNVVGWTSVVSAPDATANRDNTLDPRLAGVAYQGSTPSSTITYQIDLPAPGAYDINLAIGDAITGRSNMTAAIYDGTTLGTLLQTVISSQSTGGADQWFDASGTLRTTAAAWVAANPQQGGGAGQITLTFATSHALFAFSNGGSNFVTVAHIWMQAHVAASGVPVWLYFGQSLALGAGAKLARDLIRNPIRSRRRLLTGRDDR